MEIIEVTSKTFRLSESNECQKYLFICLYEANSQITKKSKLKSVLVELLKVVRVFPLVIRLVRDKIWTDLVWNKTNLLLVQSKMNFLFI